MKIRIVLLLSVGIFFTSCMGNHSKEKMNSQHESISSTMENKKPKSELAIIKELVQSQSAIIIDVRTPEEFAEGHIAESINIPVDIIADSIEPLREHKNIVVVCRSGNRSATAKTILENNGIENVYNGIAWDSLDDFLKNK